MKFTRENFIKPVMVGGVEIPNTLWLAPLAGYSHKSLRVMARRFGAGFAVTEMVSVEGVARRDRHTLGYVDLDDGMTAVQLFGGNVPRKFYEASLFLLREFDARIIDINFGCPVKKVVRNGAGSFLLTQPEVMGDIVKAVKDSGAVCTAKIRSGYNRVNFEETIPVLEQAGADAIILHPRLGVDFFRGHSDWTHLARARQLTKLPLVANGDVNSPQDAEEILTHSDADALMIGRGAVGRPFLFRQIIDYFQTGQYGGYSLEEIKSFMLDFARLYVSETGQDRIVPIRSPLIHYISGFRDCKHTRRELSLVQTLAELERVLSNWGDK